MTKDEERVQHLIERLAPSLVRWLESERDGIEEALTVEWTLKITMRDGTTADVRGEAVVRRDDQRTPS